MRKILILTKLFRIQTFSVVEPRSGDEFGPCIDAVFIEIPDKTVIPLSNFFRVVKT